MAGLAKALELGVDALCITTRNGTEDSNLWKTAFQARKERNAEADELSASSSSGLEKSEQQPEIVVGSCWRRDTKGTVLADRISIDLVQTLLPEEGCWVSSLAKLMALVLSEAASSQFVPTRSFRVNAGPVHSYILLGDGISTKYLCELQPSDQVMVYITQTNSRERRLPSDVSWKKYGLAYWLNWRRIQATNTTTMGDRHHRQLVVVVGTRCFYNKPKPSVWVKPLATS